MAETKIVIVAGQEFSVPSATETEAIRQQLVTMGFADVAAATVQTGTKTVDQVDYETIEFVKKAGTKGLDGHDLAALLATVPAVTVAPELRGLSSVDVAQVRRLMDGTVTYAEALDNGFSGVLDRARSDAYGYRGSAKQEGGSLCAQIDGLLAVAVSDVFAW